MLDIVVFGKACSENINDISKPGDKIEDCDESEMNNDIAKSKDYLLRNGDLSIADLRLEMQKTMQKHAGVFRNDELLEEGTKKMNELYKSFERTFIDDKTDLFNTEYIEMLELKNLLDNSLVTMHSANFRKESRGAHSHQDYPDRDDDNWLIHTIGDLNKGDVKISTRDVIMEVLDNEVEPVPLAKRVY